jgi:hypothetical protein
MADSALVIPINSTAGSVDGSSERAAIRARELKLRAACEDVDFEQYKELAIESWPMVVGGVSKETKHCVDGGERRNSSFAGHFCARRVLAAMPILSSIWFRWQLQQKIASSLVLLVAWGRLRLMSPAEMGMPISMLGRACGLNIGRTYDPMRALRKLSARYLRELWQITVERRRDRDDSTARGVVRAEWGETKRRLGTTGRNGKKQPMPAWSTASTQPLHKIKRQLSGWNRVTEMQRYYEAANERSEGLSR